MKPSAIIKEATMLTLKEILGAILDDLDERIDPKTSIECTREEREFLDELRTDITRIKSFEGNIYGNRDKSTLFKQSEFRTLLHRVFE